MRRPDAGVVEDGAATLVMVVLPAPAPSTELMTLSYSMRSVALVASCAAVAPAASIVVQDCIYLVLDFLRGLTHAAAKQCAATTVEFGLHSRLESRYRLLVVPSSP